jgi:hypothetical protein
VPGFVRFFVLVAMLAGVSQACTDVDREPAVGPTVTSSSPSPTASVAPPPAGDCAVSLGVVQEGDVVIGTAGADEIDCAEAASAKVIFGQEGDDSITGSGMADRIMGGAGDDTLAGGRGPDLLDGEGGADTVSFRRARAGVTVDLRTGQATGEGHDELASIRNVTGSGHDDVLLGSAKANDLRGGHGNDYLDALGGEDALRGGPGNDTLLGGEGRDTVGGGGSRDACAEGAGGGRADGCEALPLGEAMSVTLFHPAETVIGVGFHESLFPTAQEILPQSDGEYVVMASRGRGTPATSAADIVVPSSSPVLSPVTGTVVDVIRYLLYCRSWDWELVIEPYGQPDVRVILLHFVNPLVEPGDRVVASVTPVGTSWTNDSPGAQENDVFPDQYPHVHVEVEQGTEAPIPGCLSSRDSEP